MSLRYVSFRHALGEQHPILDPAVVGELVIDHAHGTLDCSTCDNGISATAQIILKRDRAATVFAILCPFCAPKHIAAARARAKRWARSSGQQK